MRKSPGQAWKDWIRGARVIPGTGPWSRRCSLLQADSAAAPARQRKGTCDPRKPRVCADRSGERAPRVGGSREPGRDGGETEQKEQFTGRQGQE